MDAQPPFPRDCRRCGSHDADGDSAETGCLGKSRVAKGRRRFEFGLDRGTLDKHFTDLVHVELRADGATLHCTQCACRVWSCWSPFPGAVFVCETAR